MRVLILGRDTKTYCVIRHNVFTPNAFSQTIDGMKTILASLISWLSEHWNRRTISKDERALRKENKSLKALLDERDATIAERDATIELMEEKDRTKDVQHRLELEESKGKLSLAEREREDVVRAFTHQMKRREVETEQMQKLWERNGHANS